MIRQVFPVLPILALNRDQQKSEGYHHEEQTVGDCKVRLVKIVEEQLSHPVSKEALPATGPGLPGHSSQDSFPNRQGAENSGQGFK